MVRVCWLRNGNFFLFFYYSTCLQPPAEVLPKGWSFNLRPRDKKSSKAQKSISCMCLLHTHKMLLAWSCLQWWLSLESSTIPLVRAFIQKSWYLQALCFLLLSWKACLSAGRGWITRLEQNLEVHREQWCRRGGAEVVPCQQRRQAGSVPRPANPDLLVPRRSLAPNANYAAFLHKLRSGSSSYTKRSCLVVGFATQEMSTPIWMHALALNVFGECLLEGRGAVLVHISFQKHERSREQPSGFASWCTTANSVD